MAKKKKLPEPIVESLAIGVSPERAWEALTSPRVIGDLVMGHVEIDARPGKPFVWTWSVWAKAAPGRGGEVSWRGTVLDAVPGSTLVLGGGGTTAVFTVKGEGNAALVTVVQASVPPGATPEDFQYGWADFLLRLKTMLERPVRDDSLYLRTLVRGTPSEVVRAWLGPTVMSKLLPGKAKLQPRVGGRFEWQWKSAAAGTKDSGWFLEIEKGRHVAFTWEGTVPPSEVRVAAERMPYGTLVSLEHLGMFPGRSAGAPHGRSREGYRRMWAHLLERLRAYFYFGKKIRS